MYNEFQKRRFLKYCEQNIYNPPTVKLIERIFNSTEMSEKQFGKDLVEFTQPEVMDLLKNLNSRSRMRLRNTCVYLSKYHDWCYRIEHIIESIVDPYEHKSIDPMIEAIITKEDLNEKFVTKDQFLEMMNDIIEVSNKFIAYAIYNGLNTEELRNLKINDLDFDNNKLTLVTGRTIKVDTLFKHLMIETNDQTHYFEDGIEKDTITNPYAYVDSPYVLKPCNYSKYDKMSTQVLSARLKTIRTQTENDFISIAMILKNGLINYIKEQYAKQNIDLKTAILSMVHKKLYKYDDETQKYIEEFGQKTTARMLRMEIKEFLDRL